MMKTIHRILFALATANMVAIFLKMSIMNPPDFTKWIDGHSYILICLYLSIPFYIYAVTFCVYDSFKQHRSPIIKYGFLIFFILGPFASQWKYFEMYIFNNYFFAQKVRRLTRRSS